MYKIEMTKSEKGRKWKEKSQNDNEEADSLNSQYEMAASGS